MIYNFNTDNEIKARAAFIIYAIYKSRDVKRGPTGMDMWAQIERFAKASAKRNTDIDGFVNTFKKKMACGTVNPYFLKNENEIAHAVQNLRGEIAVFKKNDAVRSFALNIFEDEETGREVVKCIYEKTQIIILLVRDRLEREKTEEVFADED